MGDKRNVIWLTERMDTVNKRFDSKTLCTAKWLQSTTLLHNGYTHSCHHCPSHKIDEQAVQLNPSSIHNTPEKRYQRYQMLVNERPEDCSYCWTIEDQGNFSDRSFKSTDASWSMNNLDRIQMEDVYPSYLEVSFDSACNLKCMYCSPEVSSKWMEEIVRHGPYPTSTRLNNIEHLKQSGRMPIKNSDYNPYIEGFWKWWPELVTRLNVFRMTGGEPLMSKHAWSVLDYLLKHPQPELELGINTNLSNEPKLIERFLKRVIELESCTSKIQVYTSCEATGEHAEYIRYGLDYTSWQSNCERLLSTTQNVVLNFMTTISALSLPTLEAFSVWLVGLRRRYPGRVVFTYSMLRWPEFMDLRILPTQVSLPLLESLVSYLEKEGEPVDSVRVKRLVSYASEDLPNRQRLEKDFIAYYNEYDRRRGTCFSTTFPSLAFLLGET